MGTSYGLPENSMIMSKNGNYDQQAMGMEEYRDLVRVSETQDINYIMVTGQNPDLPKIKKFCLAEKNYRMLILDSEKSIRQLREQMNIFSQDDNESDTMDR